MYSPTILKNDLSLDLHMLLNDYNFRFTLVQSFSGKRTMEIRRKWAKEKMLVPTFSVFKK